MAEGDLHFKAYIDTDTTSFQHNIKQAQSSVTSLSNTFGGLSKVITKALSFAGITMSVGAIVKFGKESVKAAESANKSFNVLNNTIRATGATAWTTTDDIVQMSKELADASNYTVSEIQDMQSVLLGFRNITGDTFEEASEAIMDMATVMGMDLKSATQTVGKALDDPIKGLDSLRRQGFQFTDEQKEQLTQLIKNGNQLEAQKIILEELATTYGGAAKAAQSNFAKAKNATIELKETLGNQLMPVINEVLANSTSTIKQLTAEIQKIDFSRIFAMIKNIANMIKPAFEDIINYFREFGNEVKGFFKSDTVKPFLSILDTVLGVLKALFNEVKSNFDRVKEMFANMKEGLGGLADGGALQNISDVINKIIDVIWFLREQILRIKEEIKTIVFDAVKNIWNFIKQLFDNSNKALEENEKGFASWAEFFWSQFDQVFRVAQDLINGISALLHGNWAVAWEYAKLATMRACKVVLDAISQVANAFPGLVNKMIDGINAIIKAVNKVKEWLGQEPIDLLQPFKNVDLTESSGLGKAISDAENKIQELTGKAADVSIKSLKGISKASQGMAQQIISDITDVTDTYVSNSEKQYAAVSAANNAIAADGENTYEMYSEWDSKLLEQRLGHLKEWQKEYHDITLKLIEEERKKAHEADKTGADTAKINQYYDKMILEEKKRYAKAMVSTISGVVGKIANVMKNIASTVVVGIKNMFTSFGNILSNLFDFNPDEALDDLLVFEDKILTFFVETLPKIPQFLASAFQSVATLLNTILDSVNFESLLDGLVDSVTKILKDIPKLIAKAIPKMLKTVSTLFKEFKKILPDLKNTFKVIVEELFKYLPDFVKVELPAFLSDIISLIPTLMGAGSTFIKALVSALPGIIQTIIDAFIAILQDPKEIADLAVSIVKAFVEVIMVVVRNIGPLIKALLPAIATIIIEIFKALPQLLWDLTKSIGSMILDVGKWIVNMIIDGINLMLDGISKVWTWIPGTKGIPHIPHFANGTDNAQRGLALVGEAGPELVRFNGGEKVLNNHNTQKALAGLGNSGNTFNVTFNNLQDTSAYAMMSQLRQYNRQMAINGVI